MSMHEPSIPSYYVVGRDADVSEALHFMSCTPIYCCLVTDQLDFQLAQQYCEEVILTMDPHTVAQYVNEHTGRCSIIISQGDTIETYYAKEELQGP